MLYIVLIASVKKVILVRLQGIFKQEFKKNLLKLVLNLTKEKTNIKTKTVTNAAKRSSIAEHLINNTDCGNIYILSRFRVVSHCNNVIDQLR